MLFRNHFLYRLAESDRRLFESVVPKEHRLRKVLEILPWDDFDEQLAQYYARDIGRPADPPVLMLKLEILRYFYHLSDREVIERSKTDLAFRYFLQLPLQRSLPDPSSLTYFRARLKTKGFRKIFNIVVQKARENGIVKDRLRLKDATHVIANMAVPSALALVAQTRDKLLEAAEPFASVAVEGERVNLDMLREKTKAHKPAERLITRLHQLREMLFWIDEICPPEGADQNRAWQTLVAQRDLAHKILDDQEHPGSGDRTLSTTDPDARYGKHGEWFVGYLTDVLVDADSEIITAVNVLPAGGDEAADAVELIRQEEAAHGNDVEMLSIDGVGFNGPVLRELEDQNGLNVETFVPPPPERPSGLYAPQDFEEDREQGVVTCPAGQKSKYRFYDKQKETTKYQFAAEVCAACPLLSLCMKERPNKKGRTVCKSDYQAEHERARKKAGTAQYAAIRREHPKIERKLGEIMNRHGGRRARYRGIAKVLIQQLMACTAANVKRLVRLCCAHTVENSFQT